MGWPLIGVLNAGIQILLIIASGYAFSKFNILEGDRFMPQANTLMVMMCFPAFNLSRVGIQLDLQDADAWRSLSAYMLWIFCIQMGIIFYTWVFNKGDMMEAGLLNLILTARNTVIQGLPIMYATTGTVGARISLLTSVALFLQVTPFSIVLFELHRWLMLQVRDLLERQDTEKDGGSKHPKLPALPESEEGSKEEHSTPEKGASLSTASLKRQQTLPSTGTATLQVEEAQQDRREKDRTSERPSVARDGVNQLTKANVVASDLLTDVQQALSRVQRSPNSIGQARGAEEAVTARVGSARLRRNDVSGGMGSTGGGGDEGSRVSANGEDSTHLNNLGSTSQIARSGAGSASQRSAFAAACETPFMQQANEPSAGLRPWVDVELQPQHWQDRGPQPSRVIAQRAATVAGVPELLEGGHARRTGHFQQIALAHEGHAASVTVAELSRSKWAQSYLEWHARSLEDRTKKLRERRCQPSLAAVDIPLPMEWAQLEIKPREQLDKYDADQVLMAKQSLIEDHGGQIPFYKRFLTEHAQVVSVFLIVVKNPMLWSLMLALLISVSGLRKFLDPASPQYVEGLGWIAITLQQLSNITVPLALFSNGIWMYGKDLRTSPVKVCVILALKVLILPLLQMGCALAVRLDAPSALSLVLLSSTPTASTAFVVAASYNYGTELVTLATVVATVLLVPVSLLWLYLPGMMGVWDYDLSNLPMT